MAKGFILSTDLTIAVTAVTVMLFVGISFLNAETTATVKALKSFELQKNALFIADSLVKNNSKNPLLGSAVFDEEKRRVKALELSHGKLSKAKTIDLNGLFVKELSIKRLGGEKKKVFFRLSKPKQSNCVAVNRIALIDGQKSIVEVTVCEK